MNLSHFSIVTLTSIQMFKRFIHFKKYMLGPPPPPGIDIGRGRHLKRYSVIAITLVAVQEVI
jgi:hypothetical protein